MGRFAGIGFENRLDRLIVNGMAYLTIGFKGLLHRNCGLLLKYRVAVEKLFLVGYSGEIG